MPSNYIYIWGEGDYDRSRWISISHRGADSCLIQLTDLSQPGRPTKFGSVVCPTVYLKTAIERGGSLQATLSGGYLLIQRVNDRVLLEFRGREDHVTVKAGFRAEDVLAKLESLEEAGRVAVAT